MTNNDSTYYILKRNGEKEPVFFDKITKRISKLVNPEMKVNVISIVKKTIESIYSGITTKELDEQSAYHCASMATIHYDYGLLAGRICMASLHEETTDNFVEKMEKIQEKLDIYNTKWIEFLQKYRKEINESIDYKNDYNFDYFGVKTMEKTYMIRLDNKIIERPQDVFMRVSSLIHLGDIESTISSYKLMSDKYFTHASPTLFNAGNKYGNLVSCFLLGTEDSISGITRTWNDVSKISKWGGGIGIHVSNVRAKGSVIRSTNGTSDGIIPMLQVYNSICRYINQSGKRKGSFSIYLEPHHADVIEFLELRKNTGADSERARDLFLALWVSDLFMKQVKADGDWYLFCPDSAPNLNNVYGNEYEELYNKYVSENLYKKKIKARVLWDLIQTSQFETGSPYIAYKDNVNNKTNQKNIGIIKSSNLCIEIMEYSDTNETAACNLASISLPAFIVKKPLNGKWTIYTKENCKYCKWAKSILKDYVEIFISPNTEEYKTLKNKLNIEGKITFPQIYFEEKIPQIFSKESENVYFEEKYIGGMEELYKYTASTFDYTKLWNIAYDITKNLDLVIDKNYYPTEESKRSNMRHRPIGLGVQGLADVLALMRISYSSSEALEINKKIFSTIYHASLQASVDISKQREPYMKILNKYFEEKPIPDTEFYDPDWKTNNLIANTMYHKLKPYSTEFNILKPGSYSTFEGSPFSEGKLQFHLWNVEPEKVEGKCWDTLISDVKKYGTRNSLLTALMPTASTSQLLGNFESFEPFTSNMYTRRTIAGEFVVVNKHLIQDLIDIGVWSTQIKNQIMECNGSIQTLDLPLIIKKIYLTSYEMGQKWIIDGCIARGPYIDQSQSMNLYFDKPDSRKLTSTQFYAWENGLKTGVYYIRSKPSSNASKIIDTESECVMCSA